jgi:hypothetical protein
LAAKEICASFTLMVDVRRNMNDSLLSTGWQRPGLFRPLTLIRPTSKLAQRVETLKGRGKGEVQGEDGRAGRRAKAGPLQGLCPQIIGR